jgi:hypothetical protein
MMLGRCPRLNRKAIATVCISGTLGDKLAAAAGIRQPLERFVAEQGGEKNS